MKRHATPLSRLVDLRERTVDRLQAELSDKQALQARYLRNIERMERLCDSTGATGALPMALSMNCAAYKQSVLLMAQAHRDELQRHNAELALAEQALHAAARDHEALDQVATRQQQARQRGEDSREQKRQDELASQVWWRAQ